MVHTLREMEVGAMIRLCEDDKIYMVGGYWFDCKQRQLFDADGNYVFLPDTDYCEKA